MAEVAALGSAVAAAEATADGAGDPAAGDAAWLGAVDDPAAAVPEGDTAAGEPAAADATGEAAAEAAGEPADADAMGDADAADATGEAAAEAAGEPADADAMGDAGAEAPGEPAADAEAAGDPVAVPDGHGVPVAPDAPGEPVGCDGMKVQADVRLPLEQAAASSRTAPDVSSCRMKDGFMFMRQIVGQVAAPVRDTVSGGWLRPTTILSKGLPAQGPTGWPGRPPPLVPRRPAWRGCVGRGPRRCAR